MNKSIKKSHVYKLLRRFYHKYFPFTSPIDKSYEDYEYLLERGVETEYGYVTLIGKPIINKFPGSRIVMGQGVVLVSKNLENGVVYNPAGINHPVMLSTLTQNAAIIIGNGVGISGSSIVSCSKIEIGHDSLLGNNSNIYDTDFHPIDSHKRLIQKNVLDAKSNPITIGNSCWIGANSTVLKGVNIGASTIIGAMSLVNKNIPSKVMAGGIPARVIKPIE